MTKARKGEEYYAYVKEWKTLWKADLDALGGYNGNSCDPTRVHPKVIQWAKEHCGRVPHFVKIINKNAALDHSIKHHCCYMSVPIPFAQEHYRELDRVITLEDGERRTWRVSFGAPRKQPEWHQGWDRVARDNRLTLGDVMVFVLVRKSHFRFTLFDADGNITNVKSTTTSAISAAALKCKEEFPESGLQDKALFVRDRDATEQNPKPKKRLLTVSTGIDLNADVEAGNEERDGSAPSNGDGAHAECNQVRPALPAKKPTSDSRRKMQKTDEGFAAPCQTLELPVEEKILKSKVESDPSSSVVNAILSTIDAPDCEAPDPYNPLQLSPLSRETCPQFEALDPFAFIFKSKRRTITALERQRAGSLAMAHANDLTEHYFVCVMLETHVYRDFHLVLPDYFAAATSLPASPTRLKFLDCAGHAWDVYSKRNACNQFALHRKYWALFALHHLLEEGDVCVFALKQLEPARSVFVRIFRVVPLPSSHRASVHSHYETHSIDGAKTCPLNN